MAVVDLNYPGEKLIHGNEGIVVFDVKKSKRGGTSLDVTGFTPDVIQEGHVIIEETATGQYKPMPLNEDGDGYDDLPAGHTYAGHLRTSIRKERPFAAVAVDCSVNTVASPFPLTSILAALKTALPAINYTSDK